MKNYLMELIALASLLLMVGLVVWHTDSNALCQAADNKPQINQSAGLTEDASKPEPTASQPEVTGDAGQPETTGSADKPETTDSADKPEATADGQWPEAQPTKPEPASPPAIISETAPSGAAPGWSNSLPVQADGTTQATPEDESASNNTAPSVEDKAPGQPE